ncbi:hypothetical protein [Kitasatospora sp. P5_F3]
MGYYSADSHADDCENCGRTLIGRQERYCSATCRQTAFRNSKQPRRWQLKPCPLCGEHFEATSTRKKYCDYYDEAERDCQTAQDDLEEAAELAGLARTEAECAHCSGPAGWTGRGRPRRFCSPRCKQADYRVRRATAAPQ